MELRKLSDRIYYLPGEERTDRPVLGYIKGDNYSLAVDAGNSSSHVEKFYRELEARGLRLPDFTVVTHWHWDHTFGIYSVSGTTIACRTTNQKLIEVRNWEWSDEAMEKRLLGGEDIEMCDRCIRLEYPDRSRIRVVPADVEFTGSVSVHLGGVHCVASEFVSSHSDDSVLIHVPEEKVVFIGDANGGDYYRNNGEYDRAKLKEMINTLDSLGVDIIVSGHDEPRNTPAIINYLRVVLDLYGKE